MTRIRRYYSDDAGPELADRFYLRFLELVDRALTDPQRHHPVQAVLCRANISGIPAIFVSRNRKRDPGACAETRQKAPVFRARPEIGEFFTAKFGEFPTKTRPTGLEPVTYGLEIRCSIQLS